MAYLDVRHSASQNVIAGVMKFAATHPEWDLQMRGNHPSNDGFAVGEDWRPDGLIIDDAWRTREGSRLSVLGHSICREIQEQRLIAVKHKTGAKPQFYCLKRRFSASNCQI